MDGGHSEDYRRSGALLKKTNRHRPSRQTAEILDDSEINVHEKAAKNFRHNKNDNFRLRKSVHEKNSNINNKSNNCYGTKAKEEKQHYTENGYSSLSENRKYHPMGYKYLEDLIKKDPNEILYTLKSSKSFILLLNTHEISKDKMALILTALGMACESNCRRNLIQFLSTIYSEFFKYRTLDFYIATLPSRICNERHLSSISYLVTFLQKFQEVLPACANDNLATVLPNLKETLAKLNEKDAHLPIDLLDKIHAIENEKQKFYDKCNDKEIIQMSAVEKTQLREPPENFKSISVMPTLEDLHENIYPFLRPNIKCGKYMDVNHYLDVQFRLLREDFICPLRDGVQSYLKNTNSVSSKSLKDVHVYKNVSICSVNVETLDFLTLIKFDITKFSGVKWETSKRLLPGSLVCLSSDNFETVILGTVAKREPKNLREGLVLLKFESIEKVYTDDISKCFTMIETHAYFESYRHILNSLQEINEDRLPLKDYIVDAKASVKPPAYLHENTVYDLRPIMMPLPKEPLFREVNDETEDIKTKQTFPSNINYGSEVSLLNPNSWQKIETEMDKSQEAALKLSLTKEFAVIQGPPGTGKTYVGLRIVQTLLHNWQKWSISSRPSSILVICYTNHALDQFLEGILLFTSRIVRIGGSCNSSLLEPYRLRSLQKAQRENKSLPSCMIHSLNEIRSRTRDTLHQIKQCQDLIVKSQNSILNCKFLLPVMSHHHYTLLENAFDNWLNCFSSLVEETEEHFTESTASHSPQSEDEEEDNDDQQDDLDYILGMREIDDIYTDNLDQINPDQVKRYNEKIIEKNSEWKTQGNKKKLKRYITNQLKLKVKMTDEEVKKIKNPWKLNMNDRWNLYRFWIDKYLQIQINATAQLQKKYNDINKELAEIYSEVDLFTISKALVIGMTTTGAAKYRKIVQSIQPKILIVEEAAEVLEAHIVTALSERTQHLILIGDHQQLRPSPTVYKLCKHYNLDISLFERMLNNGMEHQALSIQHRMRPNISRLLVPHIYKNLEDHISVSLYENIKGVNKNVFFINHDIMESSVIDSHSHSNLHEASFLVALCRYFLLQGYKSSSITILTTYSGQFFLIKKLFKARNEFEGVRVAIIDNFQGEENDIILISFVRSNEEGEIGFLKTSNRICVSLSRAKKGLFCIGNFELLLEKSVLWKNVISNLEKEAAIGQNLHLICQNHPKNSTFVSKEMDFKNVPEGGCLEPCEYRLECGHACTRSCHVYDPEHLEFKCKKNCQKIVCSNNHLCKKKCFEECGKCMHMVLKTVPTCQHSVYIPCHEKPENFACTMPCKKYLQCGHKCLRTCGEFCESICLQEIKIISPCGHEVLVACSQSTDYQTMLSLCNHMCSVQLNCEHKCLGKCNTCLQGRLHVKCNEPCKKILICGHECSFNCARNCPPCQKKCENECFHSLCPLECGVPCKNCNEQCNWKCEHQECFNLCSDLCSRSVCIESCNELLNCGHKCIGICGEPCPNLCRICDKDEVTTIFFGNEDEENTKFVELEDCKHVLELSGLTKYMEMTDENNEIQMKSCPKCKTAIRTSRIFGNITKKCLEAIEKVKQKFYGEKESNENKRIRLMDTIKDVIVNSVLKDHYQVLHGFLENKKTVGINNLITIENTINLLKTLEKTIKTLSGVIDEISDITLDHIYTKSEKYYYILSTTKHILNFLMENGIDASEQQQQSILLLISNLQLISQLLKLRASYEKSTKWSKVQKIYTDTLASLTKFAPISKDTMDKAEHNIKKIKETTGDVLGITNEEKVNILEAMKLKQGHWFECPNGHIYCITECGGAMEESKCNECGALIGGQSHALRSDNRLSSRMDNARHPAWSAASNMANFVID